MPKLTAQDMDQRIGESQELLKTRLDEMGEPEETVKHPVSGRNRLPLKQTAQKEKLGRWPDDASWRGTQRDVLLGERRGREDGLMGRRAVGHGMVTMK